MKLYEVLKTALSAFPPAIGVLSRRSVCPSASSTTPRIEPVTVSPIAREAEMMVVESISPITINSVCARRLGIFLSASFTSIRLRDAMPMITRLVTPRIDASEMDSQDIGRPKRVSKV